jgi:hypothetical protein
MTVRRSRLAVWALAGFGTVALFVLHIFGR